MDGLSRREAVNFNKFKTFKIPKHAVNIPAMQGRYKQMYGTTK